MYFESEFCQNLMMIIILFAYIENIITYYTYLNKCKNKVYNLFLFYTKIYMR